MAFYSFEMTQYIPASPEEVWEFIASPHNLKKITPPYMGFDITSSHLPEKVYPGLIISYRVSPVWGIKTTWVTEISQVKHLEYFVDEQRTGPYRFWHHQHHIRAESDGVLMTDIVSYSPPLGILGAIANACFIRKRLHNIFDYRRKKIIELFGEKPLPGNGA